MILDWHGLKPYATITLPDRWPWEKVMKREELIEKMLEAGGWFSGPSSSREGMAAALDIAVEELLSDIDPRVYADDPDRVVVNFELTSRRSRYLPKSDPAVEAVRRLLVDMPRSLRIEDAEEIVAVVRKADAK